MGSLKLSKELFDDIALIDRYGELPDFFKRLKEQIRERKMILVSRATRDFRDGKICEYEYTKLVGIKPTNEMKKKRREVREHQKSYRLDCARTKFVIGQIDKKKYQQLTKSAPTKELYQEKKQLKEQGRQLFKTMLQSPFFSRRPGDITFVN
ncbi:MAG: hypothetical protein V1743_07185 [Nanoarchaeota archaeon]